TSPRQTCSSCVFRRSATWEACSTHTAWSSALRRFTSRCPTGWFRASRAIWTRRSSPPASPASCAGPGARSRLRAPMTECLFQLRWTGRFGNRMFQYAYGTTYAKLTGLPYMLPSEWEGTRLFRHQDHRVVDDDEIRLALNGADEGPEADGRRMDAV